MYFLNKTKWYIFTAMPMLNYAIGDQTMNFDLILQSMLLHEIAMSRGERVVFIF